MSTDDMEKAYNRTQDEINNLRLQKEIVWKLITDKIIDHREGKKRLDMLDNLIERQIAVFN